MNHRRFDCFTIPIYITHRVTEGIAHRIGDTDLPNHESLPRREGRDRTVGRRRGGSRLSVTLADDRILGRRLGCRCARLRQGQFTYRSQYPYIAFKQRLRVLPFQKGRSHRAIRLIRVETETIVPVMHPKPQPLSILVTLS